MADIATGRGTGSGLRLTVRIRGGDHHREFISRVSDPAGRARSAAGVIRRRVLPAVRRDSPMRTGKLRGSLNIHQRGERVQLRGVGYAPLVRWRTGRTGGRRFTVAGVARDKVRRYGREILSAINGTD